MHHDNVHLHPKATVPSLPYGSEIWPAQDFEGQGHYGQRSSEGLTMLLPQ